MKLIAVIIFNFYIFSSYSQNNKIMECNPDSIRTVYYENGKVWFKASYKNGKKNGAYFSYHKNGQLSCVYIYKNDKVIDGNVISYDDEGYVDCIEFYKNGEAQGKWYYYDKGKITYIRYFHKGIFTKTKYLDENGKVEYVEHGTY